MLLASALRPTRRVKSEMYINIFFSGRPRDAFDAPDAVGTKTVDNGSRVSRPCRESACFFLPTRPRSRSAARGKAETRTDADRDRLSFCFVFAIVIFLIFARAFRGLHVSAKSPSVTDMFTSRKQNEKNVFPSPSRVLACVTNVCTGCGFSRGARIHVRDSVSNTTVVCSIFRAHRSK